MTDNPFRFDSDDSRHELRWWTERLEDVKAQVWSLIAAYAHGFSYNYQYLVHFLQCRNDTSGWGGDPTYYRPAPIPTPVEFIEVLQFRTSQLERALIDGNVVWSWPEHWGTVSWSGPVAAPVRTEDYSLLDIDPAAALWMHLLETRQAIRVHEFLLAEATQPLAQLIALDREEGLKDIRDFTKAATKLAVIDPYVFAGPARQADDYVRDFSRVARIGPQFKALHIVYSSTKGNTFAIRKGIVRAAREAGTVLTYHDTDLIHDRIWIRDRSRALVVGTSFGGIGSRVAFLLPLPTADLARLLGFLDSHRLFTNDA